MKKIDINVKENATIADITKQIAKAMMANKQLGTGKKEALLISNGTLAEVIESQLQINVTRDFPKAEELKKCHCGTEYLPSAGVKYKNNYGGTTRTNTTCSDKCFEDIKFICGDRVARVGTKLKPIITAPSFIGTGTKHTEINTANMIRVSNDGGNVSFSKNGMPYEPNKDDLKAILGVLKLTLSRTTFSKIIS